ncbi:MAG: hypothetical protein KDK02_02735 [Rhodobacteraceae bacterium]|nr:hypothetical protein [Paracoccaceae bacterium]
MTNRLAAILGLIILCAVALDLLFFGTRHLVFLGKKLFELTEWMAFWH